MNRTHMGLQWWTLPTASSYQKRIISLNSCFVPQPSIQNISLSSGIHQPFILILLFNEMFRNMEMYCWLEILQLKICEAKIAWCQPQLLRGVRVWTPPCKQETWIPILQAWPLIYNFGPPGSKPQDACIPPPGNKAEGGGNPTIPSNVDPQYGTLTYKYECFLLR